MTVHVNLAFVICLHAQLEVISTAENCGLGNKLHGNGTKDRSEKINTFMSSAKILQELYS